METIEQNNKMIAEYMDGVIIGENMVAFPDTKIGDGGGYMPNNRLIIDLDYHINWNTLLKVVDIIKSEMVDEYTLIDKIDDALMCTDIEGVYNACVEFIEWFNAQKN